MNQKKILLPALMVIGSAFAAPMKWNYLWIDSTGEYGMRNAMAITKTGSVHILAYDKKSYQTAYFTLKENKLKRVLLGVTTEYSDIIADSAGRIHMAMILDVREPRNPRDLVYILEDGSSRKVTVLDTNYTHYFCPTLALKKSGKVGITSYLRFYHDGSPARDLYYIHQAADGTWVGKDIDSSAPEVGKYNSLAYDDQDRAHILYIDVTWGKLLSQTETDTGFYHQDIGTGDYTYFGSFVKSKMGTDNLVRSAFLQWYKFLLYTSVQDKSGGWKVTKLDSVKDVDANTPIGYALDKENNQLISYRNGFSKSLNLAKVSGDSVEIQVVDTTANPGFSTALALDDNGFIYISYCDSVGRLKLATTNPDFKILPASGLVPGKAKKTKRTENSTKSGAPLGITSNKISTLGIYSIEGRQRGAASPKQLSKKSGSQEKRSFIWSVTAGQSEAAPNSNGDTP